MKLPAYTEYKPSGIDWLGNIPSHWNSVKIKRKYKIVNGSTPSSADSTNWGGDIIWITPADFSQANFGYIKTSQRQIAEEGLLSCGTTLIPKKSIVISTRAPIGEVVQSAQELCTNQGCKSLVLDSDNAYERFHYYALLCNSEKLNSLGLGTTFMELSKNDLGNFYVPIPPMDEQIQIANILDHKTAQIDCLIEKKKALIEKLNEKRIALITQAVTKGLNPDAPMKPSGVDWLGDVPAHWDVRRLRFAIQSNPLKSKIDDLVCDDMVSFVPMDAVGEYGGMRLDMEKPLEEVYDGYTYFRDNDVVIAKITPCFENGKGAKAEGLTNGVAFGTTELHVMRPLEGYSSRWLFYLSICHSFREIGASEMYGAGGQKRVPESFIKDFRIGIPNFDEQESIADFIDSEVKKMDEMLKVTKVSEFKKYGKILINK